MATTTMAATAKIVTKMVMKKKMGEAI